jgi:hypothetical protein
MKQVFELIRGIIEGVAIAIADVLRPYPNEHAARVREPGDFKPDSFRRKNIADGVDIIIGKLKAGGDSMVTQAYRFKADVFTADEARAWLKKNDIKFISFEPANGDSKRSAAGDFGAADFPAVVRAETATEADMSMDVVVATEKALPGLSRNFELVDQKLLMSGAELPESAPLIDSHDKSTVRNAFGSVRNFRIESGPEGPQTVGRAFFAEPKIFQLYRGGHLSDVSVCARALEPITRIDVGQEKKFGAQVLRAEKRPLDVFTRWEIPDVSLVIHGSDKAAKVRRSELENIKTFSKKECDMDFEKWLKDKGYKPEELTEAKRSELHREYLKEAETETLKGVEDKVKATAERAANEAVVAARAKESARIEAIRKSCGGKFPEIERQAVAEGWNEGKTDKALLEATRKQLDTGVGSPAIHIRTGINDQQSLEDALLARTALNDDEVEKAVGKERAGLAIGRRGNLSMLDVCGYAIRLAGGEVPAGREEIIKRAFSTMTLPSILGAVANKSLMRGFTSIKQTWRSWCKIGTVSNFQPVTRARMTDGGSLQEVTGQGEIPHGTELEESEKFNISTYAKKVVISRQDIINDDLGALGDVPRKMGIRAMQLISKLVYTHLMANPTMGDGHSLFDATYHGNYQTSASYKLSAGAAALNQAISLFRAQTDKDGQPIDVDPKVVLCCPVDEYYADILLANVSLANSGSVTLSTPFSQKGLIKEVESRLSTASYTGYSSVAWYLMGDPAIADTLEVAFLNGNQNPTLETFGQAQMGVDYLGVGYRVYHDVGVKALDWRSMIMMVGA